jgi:hypothetical protein
MAEKQEPSTSASSVPAHTTGTRKGEERKKKGGQEAGRKDTGTTGKAKRPVGKSSTRNSTGVNPKKPVDPSSPDLQAP